MAMNVLTNSYDLMYKRAMNGPISLTFVNTNTFHYGIITFTI